MATSKQRTQIETPHSSAAPSEPGVAGRDRKTRRLLLRALLVVPVAGPVITDGAVVVQGSRIAGLGRWKELREQAHGTCVDLGDSALLPGLINAHCHLDYTDMAGHFRPPRHFGDWLKQITEAKAGWTRSDYFQSWVRGSQMLLRSGTTTVADIEAVPELLPEVWQTTPLRVLSFLEMIGVTARRGPREILAQGLEHAARLKGCRGRLGLSPHAPYSTVPGLLTLTATAARRRRFLLSTHVAESAAEYEMFTSASGEMFDWLQRSTRDMSDCDGRTPVEHLHRCGLLGRNLLAVHANYLGPGDIGLLKGSGAAVVHCPRSHHYFGHAPFPVQSLRKAGVNVCLGTDSLASVCKTPPEALTLSMFEEMRTFAGNARLDPKDILRMGTLAAARALRLSGRLGELSAGAWADVIAVPFSGRVSAAYETILEHRGPVLASMIGGRWAIPPAPAAARVGSRPSPSIATGVAMSNAFPIGVSRGPTPPPESLPRTSASIASGSGLPATRHA